MNLQPTLSDDLILLRPLTEADFAPLYDVAIDPLIWEQHPARRYDLAVYTTFFREAMASKGTLVVIDRPTAKIIGSSRYHAVPGTDKALEIGWSFLARSCWGGVYNGRMKKLMIDHAFQFVDHVTFYVDGHNLRSQRAVEKLGGFRITEDAYRHLLKKPEEGWTYVIHKWNWQKISAAD